MANQPLSNPFHVVICSVCKKRVHRATAKTDLDGEFIHEECSRDEEALSQQEKRVDELTLMIADEKTPTKVAELARELNELLDAKFLCRHRW